MSIFGRFNRVTGEIKIPPQTPAMPQGVELFFTDGKGDKIESPKMEVVSNPSSDATSKEGSSDTYRLTGVTTTLDTRPEIKPTTVESKIVLPIQPPVDGRPARPSIPAEALPEDDVVIPAPSPVIEETPAVPNNQSEAVADLLKQIKEVSPKERPALMSQLKQVKAAEEKTLASKSKADALQAEKEAKNLEERKAAIGRKIERQRGFNLVRDDKKTQLEARIAELLKASSDPQLSQSPEVRRLQKRLDEEVKKLGRGEDALNGLKQTFFDELGGTEEEMQVFLKNAEPQPDEDKERATLGEVSEEDQVVAAEILGAMAAGMAIEEGLASGEPASEQVSEGADLSLETEEQVSIPENQQPLQEIVGETLGERMARLRQAYVEKDVETMSLKKRLSQHFPWLTKEGAMEEHKDVTLLRDQYHETLRVFYQEQIDALKQATSQEVREQSLEATLRDLRFGEALRLEELYAAQVKKEAGLGGKLLQAYETLGVKYNSLGLAKKIAIGTVVMGSAFALSATGGLGISMGIVGLRRFVAGAGAAVSLDALAEKTLGGLQRRKEDKIVQGYVENSRDLDGETLATNLEAALAGMIGTLDREVAKKRKVTAARKWTARIIGAGGGAFLLHHLGESFFHHDAVVDTASPQVSATEGLAEHSDGGAAPIESAPAFPTIDHPVDQSATSAELHQGGGTVPVEGGAPSVEASANLPESYALTTADSQKGLWGVLEKTLPADIDPAKKTQTIASLQNLIATKLEALSPEERLRIGFHGDINHINAGDNLRLRELVSQEEYRQVLEGKVYAAPVHEVVEVAKDTVTDASKEVVGGDVTSTIPTDSVEGVGQPVVDQVQNGSFTAEVPTESIETEPIDPKILATREWLLGSDEVTRKAYYEALTDSRKTLFATNDLRYWKNFATMGDIQMSQIAGGGLAEDQVTRMTQFEKLARMTYGEDGAPLKRETIGQYTSRITRLRFQFPDKEFNFNLLKRI